MSTGFPADASRGFGSPRAEAILERGDNLAAAARAPSALQR